MVHVSKLIWKDFCNVKDLRFICGIQGRGHVSDGLVGSISLIEFLYIPWYALYIYKSTDTFSPFLKTVFILPFTSGQEQFFLFMLWVKAL